MNDFTDAHGPRGEMEDYESVREEAPPIEAPVSFQTVPPMRDPAYEGTEDERDRARSRELLESVFDYYDRDPRSASAINLVRYSQGSMDLCICGHTRSQHKSPGPGCLEGWRSEHGLLRGCYCGLFIIGRFAFEREEGEGEKP